MPVTTEDAERLLKLLWETKNKSLLKRGEENRDVFQPNEERALSNAISMVQCLVTDVIPSMKGFNNSSNDDLALQVFSGQAEVQHIEFNCATTRDPGLLFDSYTINGTSSHVIFISHIETGTIADKAEIFKRGDIILEINKHSLGRVTIDRARWLMKSAARLGKIELSIVTCDGRQFPFHVQKRDIITSQSLHQHLHHQHSFPVPVDPNTQHVISRAEGIHRRPSFTPSLGSKYSDHEAFVTTVEVAAHIGKSSFSYSNNRLEGKNRRLVKAVIHKENEGLGLRLTGGRGSKFGDIGIFICSVEEGKPAHREGSLNKGDEVLMVNGRSIVGFKVSEVVKLLKEAGNKITFIVASKAVQQTISTLNEDYLDAALSSVSLESNTEGEVRKLLMDQETLSPPSQQVMEFIDQQQSTVTSNRSVPKPASDRDLTTRHPEQAARTRRATAEPVTSHQMIELSDIPSRPRSPSLATLSKKPITQWGRLSASNLHSPSKQSATKTIVFIKSKGKPLGFSLCGGRGSKLGTNAGIFVKAIQETGEAAKDGRLQVGDEILIINEQPVDGLTHKMAAQKIKGLNGVISLKVRSDPTNSERIGTILRKHSSVQGTPITVTLNKDDNEDIGLVIAGLTNDNEEYGIFIKHIKPFSPADKVKLLHRADQLVSVNDTSLLDVSINVAMKHLSPARLPGNKVIIKVIRPKKVEALMKLLAVDDDVQGGTAYSTGNNWQGSFRMAVQDTPYSDGTVTSPDVPLSLLDHDILNLFSSSSETDLTNNQEQETHFIQEGGNSDFPMVVEELKQAETNGDNPILASMTPILSRPSLAKQYSNEQLPNTPDIEFTTRRQSGLVNNDVTAQPSDKETSFSVQSTDTANHQLINMGPFTVSTPPTFRSNQDTSVSTTEEQPTVADNPPPKEPPPDVPPPEKPPPDVPPPEEPSPDVPPPEEPSPDVPPPEISIPEEPHSSDGSLSLGYESHQLSITKQKGKRGIGIVLSSSGRAPSNYPVIKRLLPNSVAGKHGLKVGDLVVSVNDQYGTAAGMNASEVMNAITDAPQTFSLTILRDPSFNSECTPSSSVYAQSIAYTESISSLLSDDDSISGARRSSISSQLPQIQPLIEGSPQLSSSPSLNKQHYPTRPRQPSTPPPSPPLASPPPPSTPPPSPPIASPPPPSTPPPSPPLASPPPPSTPPPSPPLASPPPPSTPPPSPPPPSTPLSSPPIISPLSTTTSSSYRSGTFTVEVMKSGIFGLGLTVAKNDKGFIEVKQISSRSPLAKEGSLKVHDLIMSVNDKDLTQLNEKQVEGLIKSLPKGRVNITAMHSPSNGTSHDGATTDQTTKEPTTSTPTADQADDDDEGVVRVTLTRPPNTPLGIIVDGGSDTPLKNVYISSLKPGTTAFNCGQFQRGDQVIMCGGECFVGVTSLEAWDILTKAPLTVEFVLTRRKEINPLLGTPSDGNQSSITARPLSLIGHKRRMSYSLHFSSKNTSMEDIRGDHDDDGDDDGDDNGMKQEQTDKPPAIVTSEEKFTVELTRSDPSHKLGMGIHGGIDNPNIPEIYVKMVEPNGLVGLNGKIRRGDRLCSVNGESLAGVTRQKALHLLKNAGNTVILGVARQVTRTGNTVPTSRQYSKPESVDVTPPHTVPSSGSPSPVMRSGNKGIRRATSIVGRIGLGKAQGIKVVELHKGPTGLGILLNGSRSTEEGQGNIPITVKEVLPGGVAYKSNKINIGDELIEVNNISFEGLSYNEAIKIMKELPQGPATLTLLDKYYVIPHNNNE